MPLTQGGSELQSLPWRPAQTPDELVLQEIDARAGFNEPAKMRQVAINRGLKALTDYYQFSALSDNQLEGAIRQNLEGGQAWNAVEKVTWRFDPEQLASVLEIVGTGPVDWDSVGKNGKELALPGGGFSPPDRRQRGTNADATVPYYIKPNFDCRVTTLRIPTDTKEADWGYNSTYDQVIYGQSFRRSFELRDGAIRMIRANRTLQTELPADVAVEDTLRLPKFDNSMAWARYRTGYVSTDRAGKGVQATYEGDWVADPGACLSAAATAREEG